MADYIVICSGNSFKQAQAVAVNIEEGLLQKKEKATSMEGYSAGEWILMDFNDVIVHIFHEPVRVFYDLEGLWVDADRIEVDFPSESTTESE